MIFIFHFAFLLINENIELNLSKTIHKYNYESVIYANKEKLKKKRTGTKTNRLVSIRQFEFYLLIMFDLLTFNKVLLVIVILPAQFI